MQELLSNLGVDWHLLLSQAVNFLILLVVLRFFVYKPVVKILKERRLKIEEGLEKAEEADARLQEAAVTAKNKLKEAEKESLEILRQTEKKAKDLEAKLLIEAKEKENVLIRQAERIIESKKEEGRQQLGKEMAGLVKTAIAKTVELAPEKIDEALIQKAIRTIPACRQAGEFPSE